MKREDLDKAKAQVKAYMELGTDNTTPRPWTVKQDINYWHIQGPNPDFNVATLDGPDDAALIVKAVNSYDALVKALQAVELLSFKKRGDHKLDPIHTIASEALRGVE